MRPRILFVAEAITLAQVVRLVVLARALDPRQYDVHVASASFPDLIFRPGEFRRWPLDTVSGPRALRRLARGGRLYDRRTLTRYLVADRELLRQVRPSLVVGDLRWSLAVSAPLEGVPHAALANAYMSPFAVRDGFPLPDHPIVRLLGESRAARYFPRALPAVFDHFAAPLNQLRRAHGLPSVGSLLEVLVHGDRTLYADPPELVPLHAAPPEHVFLGPVLWSPVGALPPAWGCDPARVPVYATLGSSGDLRLLPRVIEALATEPIDLLVATAGRIELAQSAARIHVVPFVPGAEAARRARLVVSNGGSTTGYQALAEGTPVLGLAQNLEQHLAMQAQARSGAAICLPARHASAATIRAAVRGLLTDDAARLAARAAAASFARHDAGANFRRVVAEMLDAQSATSSATAAP